jgi:hypothetical protein
VRFFAEVELGVPVMRVRSMLAEPTDNAVRIECDINAWSMPSIEVAR